MADIYLKDYSSVKECIDPETMDIKIEAVQEKCGGIQKKIDEGGYEIINITDNIKYTKNQSIKVFKGRYIKESKNYEYKTQQYVGVLMYGEYRFIIGSRFDTNSEPHFLQYLIEHALADYGEVLDDTISENDIWNYLLLVMFIERLKKALRKGTYRKYRQFQYNDSRVKGQLDIARHIRQNAGLNNGKIAYNAREYTEKNHYNILFLRAFDMMQKKYPEPVKRLMLKNRDVKLALDNLRTQNEDWSKVKIRTVLKETDKKIVNNVYSDYEDLRTLSRLIIRNLGVNAFSGDSNTVTGVLIDMNKLWEEFLKNTLLNILEFEAQRPFYILDGKRKIIPDFYCESKKTVLDAKYKKPWSATLRRDEWRGEKDDEHIETESEEYWVKEVRKDLFQVMAYMLGLKCDKGGVIFPVQSSVKECIADGDGRNRLAEVETPYILKEKLSVYAADNKDDRLQEPEKYFFRIPIVVPKEADYNSFAKKMKDQLKNIATYIQ